MKVGLPFNDTLHFMADAYVIYLEVAVATSRMAIEELVDFSPIRLGFSGGGRSMAKRSNTFLWQTDQKKFSNWWFEQVYTFKPGTCNT